MKRFNRVLSLIICFAMVVISMPAIDLVFADTITITDDMGYVSFAEAQANGWSYEESDYTSIGIDADGNIIHTQTNTGSSSSTPEGKLTYKFPEFTVFEDTENNTVIKTNNYRGDISVNIIYNFSLPANDNVRYYDLRIGGDVKPAIIDMVKKTYYTACNSDGDSMLNVDTGIKANMFAGLSRNVTHKINTDTGAVSVTHTGYSRVVASTSNINFVSEITLESRQGIETGSYFTIKGITIEASEQTLTSDEITEINSIVPEALASSDGKIYDDLNLSAYENVTWSSSNTDVISNDGKVKRVKNQENTVDLTATFKTSAGINYNKIYTLTVAAADNTVVYYADGQEYNDQNVKTGEKATKPADPVKDGYDFIGWYTEDTFVNEYNFDTPVTDDVNLYAKFEIKKQKVYFRVDTFISTDLTLSVPNGSAVGTLPVVPAKVGYTAIGWVIEGTKTLLTEDTVINGDIYVDAAYGEGTVTKSVVTFKNGNETVMEYSAWPGYTLIFPDPANVTKTNYTFTHWERNGDEVTSDYLMLNKDITVNAVFTPNPVEVKFYTDEAKQKLHYTGTGYYDTAYADMPANPSLDGKAFQSWKLEDGTTFAAGTIITGPTDVYALWGDAKVIVDEDITKYTSATGGLIQFDLKDTYYTNLSFDNGLKAYKHSWKPFNDDGTAQNGTTNSLFSGKIRALVENDDTARTKTYMNTLVGEYELEFVFDLGVNLDSSANTDKISLGRAFYQLNTGGIDPVENEFLTAPFNTRLYKEYNTSNSKYINVIGGDGALADVGKKMLLTNTNGEHKYVVHFNTANQTATAWTENNAPVGVDAAGNYAKWYNPVGSISMFNLTNMERMGIGSYFTLKRIKVTEFSINKESEGYKQSAGVIAQLDETLVSDPNNVTDSFTMPAVEGVTWESSDPEVIGIDGTVNRWYDDLEVTLTATAVSDDGLYNYSKEYTMTVKAFDLVKEPIAIDDGSHNWSDSNRASIQEGKYSIEADGVKIEKITEADNTITTKENKTYYAYYDLYGTEKSDEYTATSVNNYQGVYDLTFDVENVVTSSVPMNVAVGYKNGDLFYSTATFKFSKDYITITYPDSGETSVTETVYASMKKDANIRLRIDADTDMLSLWFDGNLVFKNHAYVGPFPSAAETNMFSTVRVGVDTNNNIGDYVTIKSIDLRRILKHEISSLASTLAVADGITVSDLTGNSDNNVNGDLTKLPESIGDYTVEWSTESDQIDVETGEVYFDDNASDVVITAYIYNNKLDYPAVVRKEFNLHIRAKTSDAEYGEYLIHSLGKITNQDYGDIRYDLNLPGNSEVTWTSDSSVIGADGKIDMDASVYVPEKVKITARAYGSSKEYNLTVAPRTTQQTLYADNLPATISYDVYPNLKASGDIITEFTLTGSSETGRVNILDENGTIIASAVKEEGYFYFDYKDSDYTQYALSDGQSKTIKILTISELGKIAAWVDNKLVVDYGDYRSDASYVAKVETTLASGVSNVKITTDLYGMLKLNVDNLDYFGTVGRGVLSSKITLSTSTITGDKVTWKSGNDKVLTDTGEVETPTELTVTTLEFKITDDSDTNVSISKTFDIVVEPAESGNLANGTEVTVSKHENMSYPKENINDNNYDSMYRITSASTVASDVIFDLGSEKLVNTMFMVEDAGDVRDITISASTDNTTWTPVYTGDVADSANGIVKFDITNAKYIKLTINSADSNTVDINEVKFYLTASAAELAQLDLDNLSLPSTTSTNLTLVTKGINGSVITWSSSNEGVISNTGVVTRPAEGITVTLTASINANGSILTKTFNVYVSAMSANGPTVVGGSSGGGGGGGAAGGGSASTNVTIGNDITIPVYADGTPTDETTDDSNYYSDVDEDDWYYDAIMSLTEKGIVSGDGTGGFNPDDKVTREQFLKMLLVAAGIETDNAENTFEDVDTSAWYADYVLTAKKLNIVSGMSAAEFGIGAQISRQDMAVFIERLINILNLTIEKQEVEDFADAEDVSEYAITAVANMKAIGLIQGYNNKYYPKDSLTRAEAATVIASLLDILSEQ